MTQNHTEAPHELLLREEAAALIRRSPAVLANMAYRGVGPTYVKAGRRVLYRRSDLEAWLRANTIEPTARQT